MCISQSKTNPVSTISKTVNSRQEARTKGGKNGEVGEDKTYIRSFKGHFSQRQKKKCPSINSWPPPEMQILSMSKNYPALWIKRKGNK